jgi:hypothetical protein
VNVVIADCIFKKDQKDLWNMRSEMAFQEDSLTSLSQEDEFNLKRTIALDNIMQGSDVFANSATLTCIPEVELAPA